MCRPNSCPPSSTKTVWWKSPLSSSSSRTGSDPNSAEYHAVLWSKSLTVTATCANPGKAGTLCPFLRKEARANLVPDFIYHGDPAESVHYVDVDLATAGARAAGDLP